MNDYGTAQRTVIKGNEAAAWGASKTLDSTVLVFRIIQKMRSGEVSARVLGGPVTIPKVFNRSRSKLFFFFSEGFTTQLTNVAPKTVTVPTAAESWRVPGPSGFDGSSGM